MRKEAIRRGVDEDLHGRPRGVISREFHSSLRTLNTIVWIAVAAVLLFIAGFGILALQGTRERKSIQGMRTICIYDAPSSRRALAPHRHVRCPSPPCQPRAACARPPARPGPGRRQHLLGAPLPDRRGDVRQLHQGDRHPDQPHRGQGRRAARAHQERGRQQPGRRVHHGRRLAAGGGRQGRRVPAGAVEGARGAHPGAPAHAELAGVLDPGARDRLQHQGDRPDWVQTYEDLAEPAPEGPGLRALGLAPVQPVARRRAAHARRRGQDRGLGARAGRELRAGAQGRRHRPAARRGRRRMRRRRSRTATTSPA